MEILDYTFSVVEFKFEGELSDKFTVIPNYPWTLIPPTEKSPCSFKVIVEQTFQFEGAGKIIYKAESLTKMDLEGGIPTVEFLYQLVLSTCRDASIGLGKNMANDTNVKPILIPPPSFEKCKDSLAAIITTAFGD